MRSKLNNIQVLRAFAALSVVFYHSEYQIGSWHRFGTFGVDIFFVISGFIMAMICASEDTHFLLKRIIRIVPLYWSLTLLVFAVLVLHPSMDPSLSRTFPTLLKSLFFIPYFRPDGSIFPIIIVGWTLNCEICFYLILSLALRFATRRPALLGSGLLLIFVLAMHLLPRTAFSLFFGRGFMLEFIAGIAAYRIFCAVTVPQCISLRPLLLFLIPCSALALVLVQAYSLPRFPNLTAVGFAAFVLTQSAVLLSKSGMDAQWPLLVFLGDASYSLYLTHLFVISAFRHILAAHAAFLAPARLLGMLTIVLGACCVAALTHLAVDRPTYRYLNRRLVPRKLLPGPTLS